MGAAVRPLIIFAFAFSACTLSAENESLEFALERVERVERPPSVSDFMKYDDDKGVQTAVVTLVPGENTPPEYADLEIDLVAAIHTADQRYFDAMNDEILPPHDAVLYELVQAKKGRKPPTWAKALGKMQMFVRDVLKLEHQVEKTDYKRKNFVSADVTIEELEQAFRRKFDQYTTYEIGLRMIDDLRKHESDDTRSRWEKIGDTLTGARDFVLDLEAEGYTIKMRRALGQHVAKNGGSLEYLKDLWDVLIGFRNARVMEVLAKEVAAGDRSIAILYGAAHLPDLQTQIATTYGLVPARTRWYVAWSLTPIY